MSEHIGKIKTVFKYTDEGGDTTKVVREVDSNYLGMDEGDILCELFKDFMVAAGFYYFADKDIRFENRDQILKEFYGNVEMIQALPFYIAE